MSIHTHELSYLSDKELLARLKGVQAGSSFSYEIKVELERRALVSQVAASRAQVRAAEAAKDAALWTKRSAVSIAVSVAVLATATVLDMFR